MLPEEHLPPHALLIVTGANLHAEANDRPLAYQLKQQATPRLRRLLNLEPAIIVLSDLWYLNSEPLHQQPTISLGQPSVNALSAHLYRQLPNALVIEDQLAIQMDLDLQDLRAALWGADHQLTHQALNLFIDRGYLDRFLTTLAARTT